LLELCEGRALTADYLAVQFNRSNFVVDHRFGNVGIGLVVKGRSHLKFLDIIANIEEADIEFVLLGILRVTAICRFVSDAILC